MITLLEKHKEYYRLWYDYLKKNYKYKDYCSKIAMKKNSTKSRGQTPLFDLDDSSLFAHALAHDLGPVFFTWFNIHDPRHSFDAWWEFMTSKDAKKMEYRSRRNDPPVAEGARWILEDMGWFIRSFRSDEGRDPDGDEFLHYLGCIVSEPIADLDLVLSVNLSRRYSFQELANAFAKIVKPRLPKSDTLSFPHFSTKPKLPSVDQLRRYLFEWELRYERKLKLREIINRVSGEVPNMKHWIGKERDSDIERTLKAEISKAQKIINNTLQNVFPGKYDFTRKKQRAK